MFETVRDSVTLLEYRKVVSERFQQVAPVMLANYVAEVPEFLKPYARRPEIADFDGQLYIMGSAQDLPFYCAYIKANPAAEYNVMVFTSEEAARDRAIAVFGADPEDLLALAAAKAPEVVAEDLLDALGDDVSEAGRFSRQSNQSALASRRNNPLAKLRTVSNISNVIKSSIVGFDAKKVNKAPLLIGHSGISKSATIKSVINELNAGVREAEGDWGYRLVDIRAAFFDKMDLLGMVTLTSETDGSTGSLEDQMNERWTDSPKLELLTCTTAFVESCRAMVTKIDAGDVSVTAEDAEFVSRLREYAKTPVMFFDEINRTPKEVMNQLMVMINGHALNDYDISIAPKLAAANLPVEVEKLDELDPEAYEKVIYLVQNVDDAAKVDRFIPYIVSSDDPTIQKGAFDFLNEQDSVQKHPVLQEMVRYGFDNQILHNISDMDTDGKFPTFRGWEDTMNYLSWCIDNNEQPYLMVVKGLLGDKTARDLFRQLEARGVEVDLGTTDTSSFVDHTYRAGLPMMLLGRMGIAKTASIHKAIKQNGDESIRIDLSSTDRVNVGGFPRPAPFLREAFGFGFKEKGAMSKDEAMEMKLKAVRSPLFEQFEAEVKEAGEVPHQTTSYVPNKHLQDKLDAVRAAQSEGKRLVLVFDEINRCSPVVQSAVFEAISDQRFFGCDLKGINYSVVAAGNYDDSEGFDPESMEMGSTFDAAPIDTATMHRFATKIVRELGGDDVDQFMDYLKDTFPAAHYVAERIGKDELMELLNMPYDEMGDEEGEGGLATPVFTMRTLQALHNMLTVQHPYVFANIAMSEAAASVPYAQGAQAQAQAFLNVFDNPNLILYKEDPNMGYPGRELRNSGLQKALGLPNAEAVPVKDIFDAVRDVCISIANGDTDVIEELNTQFGSPSDFMFRAHSVIMEVENALDDSSTQLTYSGIIPSYAMDIVGDGVEQFYIENSVKAAQGVMFDATGLFNESAPDELLSQMISRHMGIVANEAQLDFNEIFMSLLIDTLDSNPELSPSADHLMRLKNVFNAHPLAAARPLSNERFTRFLNDYRNKVAGASAMLEALTKTNIALSDWPKIVDAAMWLFAEASDEKSMSFSQLGLEAYIKPRLENGEALLLLGSTGEVSSRWSSTYFGSKAEAFGFLNQQNLAGMQCLALIELWMLCRDESQLDGLTVRLEGKAALEEGSVTLGTVEGHDGYLYPDYNKLVAHTTKNNDTGFDSGSAVDAAYSLRMRNGFKLARIDGGTARSKQATQNSEWYVDLSFKTNHNGVAVHIKATDVLAVADKALIRYDMESRVDAQDVAKVTAAALLAVAKAATDGVPAVSQALLGDTGREALAQLALLDGDDLSQSAAFLQLNYDVALTKKGGRTEVGKVEAVEMLRRANAPDQRDESGLGMTDVEQMFMILAGTRAPRELDTDKVTAALKTSLEASQSYMPLHVSLSPRGAAIDNGTTERMMDMRKYTINKSLERMAKTLRGVWR